MLFFFFFPFTSAWIIDKRPYSTARNYNKLLRIPSGVWQTGQRTTAVCTQNAPLVDYSTFSRTADVKGGRSIRCQIDIEPCAWVHATQKSARNIHGRAVHNRYIGIGFAIECVDWLYRFTIWRDMLDFWRCYRDWCSDNVFEIKIRGCKRRGCTTSWGSFLQENLQLVEIGVI